MDSAQTRPLVSIIVPVYNIEKYLSRCVESLLEQTYTNLQIILVDDGSTDSSGVICDQYAEQYENVTVVHKINGGLSSARNAGLPYVVGQYLHFLDGDDYVHPSCYEMLINNLADHDAVIFSLQPVSPGTAVADLHNSSVAPVVIEDPVMCMLLRQWPLTPSACDALYPASVAKELLFDEELLCAEDGPWKIQMLQELNRVAVMPLPLLYYVQRPASIMSAAISDRKLMHLDATERVFRSGKKIGGYYAKAAHFFTFWDAMNSPVLQKGMDEHYPERWVHCLRLIRTTAPVVLRDRRVSLAHRCIAAAALIHPLLGRFLTVQAKKIRRWRRS